MLPPETNHLFLAQNHQKPKTFQDPHYQRDPPGVHGEDDSGSGAKQTLRAAAEADHWTV
jgi:hypothetical protein